MTWQRIRRREPEIEYFPNLASPPVHELAVDGSLKRWGVGSGGA